ncbi:hypothetical protein BY458DRAFT_516456 [Sporodiniella umbellata]|nr:hypothetical protein BY458DRAFT_516456 [Sporodiniella umbellata]
MSIVCSFSFDHGLCEFYDQLETIHPQTIQSFSNGILLSGTIDTSLQPAMLDIYRLHPTEMTMSINSLYPGLAYKPISRQKLHEYLEKMAIENQLKITMDYDQLLIRFVGPIDRVEKVKVQTLVFADRLSGLCLESTKIPFYMIHLLGGKRYGQYTAIMEETNCNIYLPSLWQAVDDITQEISVHIAGDTSEDIKNAILLIQKLYSQKTKTMCNSKSILSPQKRDYLLLYKKQELAKMMRENGSFIAFSQFGSKETHVQVYAENTIHVERTLRSLNYLASHVFQVMIQLSVPQSKETMFHWIKNLNAHVLYHSHQLTVTGSKEQIQTAIQYIHKLPWFQEHHELSTFCIELASDQREFISGKKNGKINKIMKACDTQIDFHNFNQFNFSIVIESRDFHKSRDGFESLQDELPAEISFYVPEICHRRIIGVAGKNIQRVMKQYGVYVKFSSHEELASFGGYFENEHNVIARTPQKNKASLELLKSAVMNFIAFQKDKDYTTQPECVPYYAQRQLLHLNGKHLREKAKTYNTKIIWPPRNGTDHVLLIGPQSHLDEIRLRIQSVLPQQILVQVPASVALERILASQDMEELETRILKRTGIHLMLPEHLLGLQESHSPLFFIHHHTGSIALDSRVLTFKFSFDYNTKQHLQQARAMFDAFMGSRFVPLDDTLHNMLNGSPSPEDMQHISPSVMHLIDHPESYEHTKRPTINESHKLFQPWGNAHKLNGTNNFQLSTLYDPYTLDSDYPSSSCSSNSNSSNSNRFQFVPDYTPFTMNPYSRQRSTSLLPSSSINNKYYPTTDFCYPLLDRKIPSSSLSTPIPHQRNHRNDALLFNGQQGRFNP